MEKRTKSSRKVKREFAAGGVVFKITDEGKILWLIAKSSPSNMYPESYWRLPKGWLDDKDGGKYPGPLGRGERKSTEGELQNAALREVKEEGGVEAEIIKKIGTQRQFRGRNILKFVTFYLMEWKRDLPEGTTFETEEVAWLSFEEAVDMLIHKGEKEMLGKAKEIRKSGVQEVLV